MNLIVDLKMRLIINFDNGSDNDENDDCLLIITKAKCIAKVGQYIWFLLL